MRADHHDPLCVRSGVDLATNSKCRWADLVAAEPEFADRVQRVFHLRRHKTLATLRSDGSPRISGIEVEFVDGDVMMGMMPGSVKVADLGRDPRMVVHAASDDPPTQNPSAWLGDAKIAGSAVEVPTAEPSVPPSNRFRIDISEVVLTRVGEPADHLLIESWHPGRGLERRIRR
jgi:hypothetical protein